MALPVRTFRWMPARVRWWLTIRWLLIGLSVVSVDALHDCEADESPTPAVPTRLPAVDPARHWAIVKPAFPADSPPDVGRPSVNTAQPATFQMERLPGTCQRCGRDPTLGRDTANGSVCRCIHSTKLDDFPIQLPLVNFETAGCDGDRTELPSGSREALCGFVPWWQPLVTESQTSDATPLRVNLDELILAALAHSHFIQAQSNLPLIGETAVLEAAAEFDVHAFTQSRFIRTSEPIGNVLTAGPGRTRFRDRNWNHNAGVRRKTRSGASVELAQRYGYQRNNSDFLLPNPQSTARLALRFSQPLLRGAGRLYNTSVIVLAKIDTDLAWDQFSRDLQEHLVEVATSYWDLYLQRAVLLQRRRHLERASEILAELETRADIDAARSQIVRAQSAVASRRSDLSRATTAVRNAQVRVRALVNLPSLMDPSTELVPREVPEHTYVDVGVNDALVTALQKRPEVDEAMQQIRSARTLVSISNHELLPVLDLVTETYVMGLRPNGAIGEAWIDQFSVGEPSYSVGLELEVPLGNRAAKARNMRKRLHLQSIVSQFQGTVESLLAEVEVAVRDVRTAHDEMCGKYYAMAATKTELDYMTERWHVLPGDDRSASFLLEDILDIQDRLVAHEFEFALAQVGYAQSLVFLKRAMGTLLEAEEISIHKYSRNGLKQLSIDKPSQDSATESALEVPEMLDAERLRDPAPLPAVEILPAPPGSG